MRKKARRRVTGCESTLTLKNAIDHPLVFAVHGLREQGLLQLPARPPDVANDPAMRGPILRARELEVLGFVLKARVVLVKHVTRYDAQ